MNLPKVLCRTNSKKENFTAIDILVISNDLFSKQLCEALRIVHNKQIDKYRLHLITCTNIDEILFHTSLLHVDYTLFLLDTRDRNCVKDVEYNLQKMDKSFLCGRTCIINANAHLPLSDMNVPLNSIIALKYKYSLPLLNGNIMDSEACLRLSQQILILVETNLGINQKCPFIPWLQS